MYLYDAAARPLDISVMELARRLFHGQGAVFVVLTFVLMVLTDPPGILETISLPYAAAVGAIAFALYIGLSLTIMSAITFFQHTNRIGRIWSPIIGTMVITPVVYVSENSIGFIVGPDYTPVILQRVIFFYLIGQIIEFAFMHWILPRLRESNPEAEPEEVAEPHLFLGEHSIPLSDLHYLSAQEHFVRAVSRQHDVMHRARLSDLVRQVGPEHGIQPHRSWWVGRTANPTLSRDDEGKLIITTQCGLNIPVARGRAADVQDWFQKIDGIG